MPDYTQTGREPDQNAPAHYQQLPKFSVSNTPKTLICDQDTTLSISVTQEVVNCHNPNYFDLYQIAQILLDAQIARLECQPGNNSCRKYPVEMFRSWKCQNNTVQVIVAKRLFCRPNQPGGNWLDEATGNDNFQGNPGHNGNNPGIYSDAITVDVSPKRSLGSSCGVKREFRFDYVEDVTNCPPNDYEPFVTRAQTRITDLLKAIACPAQCDKAYKLKWHSWKCTPDPGNNEVKIEAVFELRCDPRPPDNNGSGDGSNSGGPESETPDDAPENNGGSTEQDGNISDQSSSESEKPNGGCLATLLLLPYHLIGKLF